MTRKHPVASAQYSSVVDSTRGQSSIDGERAIRFFSDRRSSGLLMPEEKSARLVTTLRRARIVASEKSFADC